MKTFETLATVESEGQLRLAGLPFGPGTEVEVTVHPKRLPADDFVVQWNRIAAQMRAQAGHLTDEEIKAEIDDYRAKS